MNEGNVPNQATEISVVIPVYNRESMIGQCLRSIMEQTYLPREIVVVDDASTDGTWTVLRRIAAENPIVHPVRLPGKGGAQRARNEGIRCAKFPWIAFLDSDDVWLPEKLSVEVQALQKWNANPMTVVYSDFYRQENDAPCVHIAAVPLEPPGSLKKALVGYGALFQTMLVSKTALEQIGYLDEKVPAYQEWETTIRLASVCRFIHIPNPLFTWIRHAGETISGNGLRGLEGYQYIIEKHGMDMVRQGGKRLYLRHLFLVAFQLVASDKQDLALTCLERSKINALSVRLSVFMMRHKMWRCLQKFLLRSFYRWQKLKTCLLG